MQGNEGYINVVAAMQKFFDQAISGNWSYNPLQYENNEVPMSVMMKDLLTTYKMGWKTSYYQNTYDFKGEEDNVQPAGLEETQVDIKEKDAILETNGVNGVNGTNGIKDHTNGVNGVEQGVEDDDTCEACAI